MIQRALRSAMIWASLGALGVLAISAAFKPETLPKVQACTFKLVTGLPCPGCGLTRGFCAISHGRFGQAAHFNPFSFIFYAMTLGVALWPLVSHCFPALQKWARKTVYWIWVLPLVLAAMLIFGIIRMLYGPNI